MATTTSNVAVPDGRFMGGPVFRVPQVQYTQMVKGKSKYGRWDRFTTDKRLKEYWNTNKKEKKMLIQCMTTNSMSVIATRK